MLKTLPRPRTVESSLPDFNAAIQEDRRVYAIAFDMDTDTLQKSYPGATWTNAYTEIKKVLDRHGFIRQQGSVYFGGPNVNAVTCVLASFDLAKSLPWFAISVRDIRMLRIEEMNDLLPAVLQAAGLDH
jgi:virulence-associated protein VapD